MKTVQPKAETFLSPLKWGLGFFSILFQWEFSFPTQTWKKQGIKEQCWAPMNSLPLLPGSSSVFFLWHHHPLHQLLHQQWSLLPLLQLPDYSVSKNLWQIIRLTARSINNIKRLQPNIWSLTILCPMFYLYRQINFCRSTTTKNWTHTPDNFNI